MSSYVPEAGDIVWLEFSPQAGHEQAGHRPALVISPAVYNRRSSMMVCCPMTTQIKGYPFEVKADTKSVALSDQIKNLDWRARKAKFKGKATPAVMSEVRRKIKALLGLK